MSEGKDKGRDHVRQRQRFTPGAISVVEHTGKPGENVPDIEQRVIIIHDEEAGPVTSVFGRLGKIKAKKGDYTWDMIADKPDTITGYGITDLNPIIDGALEPVADKAKKTASDLAQEAIDRSGAINAEAAAREAAIAAEAQDRIDGINAEASARAQDVLDEAQARGAAIGTEKTARQDADSSLSDEIDTNTASIGDNASAIQTEITNRASADSAEANKRTLLATQVRGNYDGSDATELTSGLLYQEQKARSDQYGSLVQQISLLSAGVGEQFDYDKIWYFTDGVEGWTGNGGTPDLSDSWITPQAGSGDTEITSPDGLDIDGSEYAQVRLRIRKHGEPTWAGKVAWAGGATDITEPEYLTDNIGLVVVNADWSGTVDQLTLTLCSGQTATDYFEVDWIAVGRPAPGASSAALAEEEQARAQADSAEVTARQQLSVKITGAADPTGETLSTLASGLIASERDARTTAISSVQHDITVLQGVVNDSESGNSALASALSGLTTEVHNNEGDISTNSSAITALQNTVTDTESGNAALASALSSLQTEVTSNEGDIDSNSSAIDALSNTVNDSESGVVANASAISALTTRVTNDEGSITQQAGQITALKLRQTSGANLVVNGSAQQGDNTNFSAFTYVTDSEAPGGAAFEVTGAPRSGGGVRDDAKGNVWTDGTSAIIDPNESPFGTGGSVYYKDPQSSIFCDTLPAMDMSLDWCVEWWQKLDASIGGSNMGAVGGPSDRVVDTFRGIYSKNLNRLGVYIEGPNFGTKKNILVDAYPTITSWHYVRAFRHGDTVAFYFDGQKVEEKDVSGLTFSIPNTELRVGNEYSNNNYYPWNGWLSQMRITFGASRYESRHEVPTGPFYNEHDPHSDKVIAYLPLDGSAPTAPLHETDEYIPINAASSYVLSAQIMLQSGSAAKASLGVQPYDAHQSAIGDPLWVAQDFAETGTYAEQSGSLDAPWPEGTAYARLVFAPNVTDDGTEATTRIGGVGLKPAIKQADLTQTLSAAIDQTGINESAITALQATIDDPESGIVANASAISALQTTVSDNGDEIDSNSSAITSLQNDLSTAQGDVSANASAISGLQTEVSDNEGDIESNSSAITSLENTVGDPESGNSALASAVSGLTTTVTQNGQTISANATALSQLTTSVSGNTATIQTQGQSIDGLAASYSVKTDVNGAIAGYGLSSTTNDDGSHSSIFRVQAGRFEITNPVQTWGAGLAVAEGDYLVQRPQTDSDGEPITGSQPATGLYYQAQGDGTTGTSEPTWPTSAGKTVTDNGLTLKAVTPAQASPFKFGKVDGVDTVGIDGAVVIDGSLTATQIAAGTITADEIAASAITTALLDAGSVTTDKLAAHAVTADKIAADTITATEISSKSITADELAANSVTAEKINVSKLSALASNVGTLTGGLIKSTSGAVQFDLDAQALTMTDSGSQRRLLIGKDGSDYDVEVWDASGKKVFDATEGARVIGGDDADVVKGTISYGMGNRLPPSAAGEHSGTGTTPIEFLDKVKGSVPRFGPESAIIGSHFSGAATLWTANGTDQVRLVVEAYSGGDSLLASHKSSWVKSSSGEHTVTGPAMAKVPNNTAYIKMYVDHPSGSERCYADNAFLAFGPFGFVLPIGPVLTSPVNFEPLRDTLDDVNDGPVHGKTVLSKLHNGEPVIDFRDGFHLHKILDYVGDGSTYGRTKLSELSSGAIRRIIRTDKSYISADDTSKHSEVNLHIGGLNESKLDFATTTHFKNKNLDHLADGSSYGRTVLSKLHAGEPIIDFRDTFHVNKTLDHVGDGSIFRRVKSSYVDSGNRITGFLGEGGLARKSQADWSSEITGSGKPSDNATEGADYLANLQNAPRNPLNLILTSDWEKSRQGEWSPGHAQFVAFSDADASLPFSRWAVLKANGEATMTFVTGGESDVQVSPGTRVFRDGWVSTSGSSNRVELGVRFFDQDGHGILPSNPILIPPGKTMAFYQKIFTAPAGAASMRVGDIRLHNAASGDIMRLGPQGCSIYTSNALHLENAPAEAGAVKNWGSLHNDGGKPANGADVTASNTAYDTSRVHGTASSTVHDYAFDGHNLTVAGSGTMLGDLKNSLPVNAAGLATSYWSNDGINQSGSTVTVDAVDLKLAGSGIVHYNAASVSITPGQSYHLYYDDANYAGGSRPLHATASAKTAINGRGHVYRGFVQTSSGGGGGQIFDPPKCITTRMFVRPHVPARAIRENTVVDIADGYVKQGAGKVARVWGGQAQCVRLTASDGAVLECSLTTPFTMPDGGTCLASELATGHHVLTDTGDCTLVEIEQIGVQSVVYVSVGGKSYAAGLDPASRIYSHNTVKK
jgi:predicted  nucleic acid-binding Zn-ribbon protein